MHLVAFICLYFPAKHKVFIISKALFSGDFSLSIKKRIESLLFFSPGLGKVSCTLPIKDTKSSCCRRILCGEKKLHLIGIHSAVCSTEHDLSGLR